MQQRKEKARGGSPRLTPENEYRRRYASTVQVTIPTSTWLFVWDQVEPSGEHKYPFRFRGPCAVCISHT